MIFYDINDKNIQVSFKDAVLTGINTKTGGVFMPLEVGKISPSMIYRNPPPSFRDIVFELARMFCDAEIPDDDLMQITAQFYPYRIPITPLAPTTYIIELFHGATCNYKDLGAGFLAYLLEYFNAGTDAPINLLVAASGERACAVSAAVSRVKNVNALILYPKDSLTEIQEKLLSCSAKNVYCFCVCGTLENCEAIANQALYDEDFKNNLHLVPGGTLNTACLIPQIAFFVYASLSILYRCGYDNKIENPEIIASVPSGGFSALTAGLIAKKANAPISGFICAENANQAIADLLISGSFQSKPKVITNTPALDAANLINFTRMRQLYGNKELKHLIVPYGFDDASTIEAVSGCNNKTGYIIDPYGGMAWKAWQDIYYGALNPAHLKNVGQTGVPAKYAGTKTWLDSVQKDKLIGLILQTSHPAKFTDIMKAAVGRPPTLPDRLASVPLAQNKPIRFLESFSDFKKLILDIFG